MDSGVFLVWGLIKQIRKKHEEAPREDEATASDEVALTYATSRCCYDPGRVKFSKRGSESHPCMQPPHLQHVPVVM